MKGNRQGFLSRSINPPQRRRRSLRRRAEHAARHPHQELSFGLRREGKCERKPSGFPFTFNQPAAATEAKPPQACGARSAPSTPRTECFQPHPRPGPLRRPGPLLRWNAEYFRPVARFRATKAHIYYNVSAPMPGYLEIIRWFCYGSVTNGPVPLHLKFASAKIQHEQSNSPVPITRRRYG